MYVTLLLIAPAVCEWVEISQQHYSKKPTRTHHFQTSSGHTDDYEKTDESFQTPFKNPYSDPNSPYKEIVTEIYEEETTRYFRKPTRTQYVPADGVTEIYIEDSLRDSHYRYRKPTRAQFVTTDKATEDYTEETTSHYRKPTRHQHVDRVTGAPDELNKPNRIYLNQSLSETNLWNKGNVNKVSKHGNVQRVQLDSNAVKAPNFRPNSDRNSINSENEVKNLNNGVKALSEIVVNTEETPQDVFMTKRITSKKRLTTGTVENSGYQKPILSVTAFPSVSTSLKDNVSLIDEFNKYNPNLVFINDEETFNRDKSSNRIDNKSHNKPYKTSFTGQQEIAKRIEDKESIRRNNQIEKGFTTNNQNRFTEQKSSEFITKTKKPLDDDYATVSDDNEGPSVSNSHHKQNQIPDQGTVDADSGEETSKEPSSDSKANTMENLMTLIKVVSDTIRRNTRRSVNSKTKYLTNLKDTILGAIKDRIDATWPDDEPAAPTRSRTARAAQATARGHLEIPSSESALMTISFLTFAVFLIKLVLQIIQAYKNKTMMVTPAVVATVGRAGAAKRNAKP